MKRSRSNDQDSQDTHRGEGKRTEGQPNIDYSSLQIYISDPKTIEILNNRGIKSLFKIQQTTFFDIHKGCDVLARDRTGSGKTLAYSLPII
jgi:superfamily II DNA/RNA helicase